MPANRTGYVYGSDLGTGLGGHQWLTVPGSYYRRPALTAAPHQAVKPAPFATILALVEEVPLSRAVVASGYGYRVIKLINQINGTGRDGTEAAP